MKTIDLQERIEWFDDRFYKVNNALGVTEFYPSVTTVLGIINKPFLLKWYGDVGTEIAQHRSKLAKEKGSLIHDGVYRLLTDGYVSSENYTQEDYYQLWNFLKCYESLNPKVLHNEVIVYSHETLSAGTLDLLVEIKAGTYDIGYSETKKLRGGNYLLDVKTGNMDLAYHYQTAAYSKMAIERGLVDDITGTGILLTKADTKKGWKLILRDKEEVEQDYQCFLSALNLFNAKGGEKPKIFEMPKELIINEIFQKQIKENGTNNKKSNR